MPDVEYKDTGDVVWKDTTDVAWDDAVAAGSSIVVMVMQQSNQFTGGTIDFNE